jgi:hypothetical protein
MIMELISSLREMIACSDIGRGRQFYLCDNNIRVPTFILSGAPLRSRTGTRHLDDLGLGLALAGLPGQAEDGTLGRLRNRHWFTHRISRGHAETRLRRSRHSPAGR